MFAGLSVQRWGISQRASITLVFALH